MKPGSVFVFLLLSWTIFPQNHFESVDSTGLPYQVIILTDSIIGYQLKNGDEIGLFADTLCVGADIYNGSGNFAVTAWEGSEQYNLPGFEDGDSIRIFIWTDIGSGLSIYEIKTNFTTGDGTFGYGTYTICTIEVVVPDLPIVRIEDNNLPILFTLDQNYPNPFNPYTEIPYTILYSSDVKLTIYNINGQEVAILLDEAQEAGNHVLMWNSSNYSSGIYFIRLEVDEKSLTRRGILLK